MIVYTCLINNYDQLLDPPKCDNIQYICYSDRQYDSSVWEIRPLIKEFADPVLTARYHKLQAFHYQTGEEFIWQDAKIHFQRPHDELLNYFQGDLAFIKHPRRNCIYKEAERIVELGKESKEKIDRQVRSYKLRNYPKQAGLYETAVFYFKNTEQNQKLLDVWWSEVEYFSRRDQMSLPVVLKRLQIFPQIMDLNFKQTSLFKDIPHL